MPQILIIDQPTCPLHYEKKKKTPQNTDTHAIVYPTEEETHHSYFPVEFALKCENANYHNILIFDQILLKLECVLDEYLCFPHSKTKTSMSLVNRFRRRLFIDTVYVKFRVCVSIANYTHDIFSLCETSIAFIHALCHSKLHFHQHRPLELIKTMLKSLHVLLGLFPVWNSYPKDNTQYRGYQVFNNRIKL